MTFANEFRLANTGQLDAFGRLRISQPLTIFDSKQIYDNQPFFWDESSGVTDITSAHSTDTASTVITYDGGVTGGTFTRQTYMRFNYQPGKSQQIMMTGILDRSGGGAGITRRIGMFDDDNGLFWEDKEGTIGVTRRTNVTGSAVDNHVTQASWNLDVMDGSGPSGVTIDWTKLQLFLIDFEWLAAGRVRMYIIVAGKLHPIHEFLAANVLDKVYMSTPNLPLRYQIVATGSSAASTMEAICGTVISEGGVSALGVLRHKSTGGTHVDANTQDTLYAIVGMRLKSTHLGAQIKVIAASIAEHQGGKHLEWLLLWNPTVAGTPTWANETNSAIQTFTGATANTVTGGTEIFGGHFSAPNKGGADGGDIGNALLLGSDISGTVDEIVLAARPIGGSTNADVEGSLSWREEP